MLQAIWELGCSILHRVLSLLQVYHGTGRANILDGLVTGLLLFMLCSGLTLIFTFGLALLIEEIVQFFFGKNQMAYEEPHILDFNFSSYIQFHGSKSFAEQLMQGMRFGIGGSIVRDPARNRTLWSVGGYSWGDCPVHFSGSIGLNN